MLPLESIFLGLIQGLTEFFPISSSGHLILFEELLKLDTQNLLAFDIVLHSGSLLAIVIFFLKRKRAISWLKALYITLPILIIAYLVKDYIDTIRTLQVVSTLFIINGIYLILTTKILPKLTPNKYTLPIISIFHIAGLFPGISRSGSIIGIGSYLGLKQIDAVKISFQSGLIILTIATLYTFTKLSGPTDLPNLILFTGFLSSLIISLLCIFLLEWLGKNNKIWWFGIYTLVLGLIITFTT